MNLLRYEYLRFCALYWWFGQFFNFCSSFASLREQIADIEFQLSSSSTVATIISFSLNSIVSIPEYFLNMGRGVSKSTTDSINCSFSVTGAYKVFCTGVLHPLKISMQLLCFGWGLSSNEVLASLLSLWDGSRSRSDSSVLSSVAGNSILASNDI